MFYISLIDCDVKDVKCKFVSSAIVSKLAKFTQQYEDCPTTLKVFAKVLCYNEYRIYKSINRNYNL